MNGRRIEEVRCNMLVSTVSKLDANGFTPKNKTRNLDSDAQSSESISKNRLDYFAEADSWAGELSMHQNVS